MQVMSRVSGLGDPTQAVACYRRRSDPGMLTWQVPCRSVRGQGLIKVVMQACQPDVRGRARGPL
jgi:hypothetical protein